ncbi:MAG: Rab family GTPase [Candidatus Heimdallarchaeota archaeon]
MNETILFICFISVLLVFLLVVIFIGAILILAKPPIKSIRTKPPIKSIRTKTPIISICRRFSGEYLFKIICVGSKTANKTALIKRYAEGTFRETYIHTLGVDFYVKVVNIGDQTVKLGLYDISQELLNCLRTLYYRGAYGAIVCYDITSKASIEALDGWVNEIYRHVDVIPIILVGIIPDDVYRRVVPREQAEAYAQKKGLPFIEVSAKMEARVNEMFSTLVHMMMEAPS